MRGLDSASSVCARIASDGTQPQGDRRIRILQRLAHLGHGMRGEESLAAAGGDTHADRRNLAQRGAAVGLTLQATVGRFIEWRTGFPRRIQTTAAQLAEKAFQRRQCLLLIVLRCVRGSARLDVVRNLLENDASFTARASPSRSSP
ncbi:hypothetical protein [Thermomonas sp.]|uniref:hypothetical protein n=1 Tax=Thermomonas sp. TaxID=1971895 RepID=UPI00261D9A6A|nr:hypothetical protein [Thermomonas sp.]MCO5054674.1 hypothetical protein [Thermomonas sp.]